MSLPPSELSSDANIASASTHRAVLQKELVESVLGDPQGTYIDATFGRGGHTRSLLKKLTQDARVLVVDRDLDAIAVAHALAATDNRLVPVHACFSDLAEVAAQANFSNVDGIMIDLGVSSPQLDEPERGFSFRTDGPLDMRMDRSQGITAAQWLNEADKRDMARVFRDYGEERFAGRIAAAILRARPLHTTAELAALIESAQPRPDRHKHAATRVFQAIRIHINDEFGELRKVLDAAWELLAPGGQLAVLSFHSGEDRIVKRYFAQLGQHDSLPRRLPVTDAQRAPLRASVHKRRRASDAEISSNPRARSVMLRSVERLR